MISYKENFSLKSLNTFGIDAKARYYTEVNSVLDLINILSSDKFKTIPKFILGGGSNVLFTENYNGLVIHIKLNSIEKIAEDERFVWIKSEAGAKWHDLVTFTIENNWSGIENLSLIPGTVGAAPMQNIGAYGVEIKETVDSLDAYEINTGALKTFTNAECKFGYRNSIFKQELKDKYIITSVTFKFNKNPISFNLEYGEIKKTLGDVKIEELNIKTVSDAIISIRRNKLPDPKIIGNAGSFFKNPELDRSKFETLKINFPDLPGYILSDEKVKVPAGWLIEKCGWKGKQIGNVGVHEKQALVLVNLGSANGAEVWDLAMQIQNSVKEKFDITLHPEVNKI